MMWKNHNRGHMGGLGGTGISPLRYSFRPFAEVTNIIRFLYRTQLDPFTVSLGRVW
jgi:hypothetical protein